MGYCWPLEEIQRKFKIGDKIKLTKQANKSAEIGATATVIGYKEFYGNKSLYYLFIKWDRDFLAHNQDDGSYFPQDFIVISESSKKEINNNCPRCKEELKDHMSFGLGEVIKKCGKCGWC
jgi:hypothetical protein